jgi:hypothetical protein
MLKFVPHMGNPIVFVAQNTTAPTAVHSSLLRGGRHGIVPPAGRLRAFSSKDGTARGRQDDRKRPRSGQ